MKFYNLKTRAHVDVPDANISKKPMVRKTKNGTQTRYAFVADYQGSKLFKFVSEADYKSAPYKEVK